MSAWEYCVVDLDRPRPGAYLLTLHGPQPLYENDENDATNRHRFVGRDAEAADVESESGSPSALIARLGADGWEMAAATTEIVGESSIGFQPHLRALRSNRLLYFKRPMADG